MLRDDMLHNFGQFWDCFILQDTKMYIFNMVLIDIIGHNSISMLTYGLSVVLTNQSLPRDFVVVSDATKY